MSPSLRLPDSVFAFHNEFHDGVDYVAIVLNESTLGIVARGHGLFYHRRNVAFIHVRLLMTGQTRETNLSTAFPFPAIVVEMLHACALYVERML